MIVLIALAYLNGWAWSPLVILGVFGLGCATGYLASHRRTARALLELDAAEQWNAMRAKADLAVDLAVERLNLHPSLVYGGVVSSGTIETPLVEGVEDSTPSVVGVAPVR